jgi:hypothetical protein
MKITVKTRDGKNVECEVVSLNPDQMKKLADELEELQSQENEGRGIRHIQAIITYLRRGDFDLAVNIYRVDGDKTNMYPVIRDFLAQYLGCRVHGVIDCPGWVCERYKKG